jgi:hypothetical protein
MNVPDILSNSIEYMADVTAYKGSIDFLAEAACIGTSIYICPTINPLPPVTRTYRTVMTTPGRPSRGTPVR